MTTPAAVLFEEVDSVASIRIDDGKVNALSEDLVTSIAEALDAAVARDRAVLILGRNGFLSAGFDLSVMRGDADARTSLVLMGLELALKLFESPIPVIVCCTGHAIAAGMLLLLPADHVIAPDTPVKIGFNETAIGIELSPFVLELARYRVLPSAHNQILRGVLYDARGARHAGYVDEIVAPDDLVPRSIEVAHQLAALDPSSYRRTKEAMRLGTASLLRSSLEHRRSRS